MSEFIDLVIRISKDDLANLLARSDRIVLKSVDDQHPPDESLPETPTDPNNSIPTTSPEPNPLPIPEVETIPLPSPPSPSHAPHPLPKPTPPTPPNIPRKAGQIRPSAVFHAYYKTNTRKSASKRASLVSRVNPGDWILVHMSTQVIRDGYRWMRIVGQRAEWFAAGTTEQLWGELYPFTDGQFIALS